MAETLLLSYRLKYYINVFCIYKNVQIVQYMRVNKYVNHKKELDLYDSLSEDKSKS